MSAAHTFTQCLHCAHGRPVEQIDKHGNMTASREVSYCEYLAEYRATRLARTCKDFTRKKLEEAA